MPAVLDSNSKSAVTCALPTACRVDPGSCCLVAGTMVRMADGGEKDIEHVVVGDRVIGRGGAVNSVIVLVPTYLGDRKLYALNGGRHFVTAEHPFMTSEGWKAIDPVAAAAENPRLAIDRLAVGDAVVVGWVSAAQAFGSVGNLALDNLALDEGDGYLSAPVSVALIDSISADPDLPLCNLALDGNHSYHADGYLVHHKEGGGDARPG